MPPPANTKAKQIKIDENEIIRLILAYLKKKNLIKTFVSLENESQVTLEQFSQETRFFRSLIFEGNFDEAEIFITQFQYKLGSSYQKAIFELKKQKYLELIDTKPDVEVLIKILKEIESLVPNDVYKNLCFFLTLKSINDHPEYIDWSVQKGRMMCFEQIRPVLKLLGKSFKNLSDVYSVDLISVIERLTLYEIQIREDLKQAKNIQIDQLMNQNNPLLDEMNRLYKIGLIQLNQEEQSHQQLVPQSQIYFQKQYTQINDEFNQSMKLDKQCSYQNNPPPQLPLMTESSFADRDQSYIQTEFEVSKQSQLRQSKEKKSTLDKRNSEQKTPEAEYMISPSKNSSNKSKLAFHNRIKSNEALQILNEQQSLSQKASPHSYNNDQLLQSFASQRRNKLNPQIQQQQQIQPYNDNISQTHSQQNVQQNPVHQTKKSSGDQDKNIIIEKLYISDCTNEGSENESIQGDKLQNSGLFSYNFDEIIEAGHLMDTHPIRAATFSSDGEYFAIGTNSKSLRVYSMMSALTKDCLYRSTNIPILFERQNHHLGSIYCIDWSRSGRLIATGSNDKQVKILVASDFTEEDDNEFTELRLLGHKGIVRSVCFTHDETKLLSAGQVDTCVRVWDSQTGQQIRTLDGHTQAIYCLQVGGEGTYQVSAGLDKTLRVWDLRQQKPTSTILMNSYAEINYVSLSESANNFNLKNIIKGSKKASNLQVQLKNQTSLASVAHADGTVSIWDLNTSKCVHQINHHKMDCRCAEFDPTTRYIATASFDSTLTVYDFEQKKQVAQINQHEDRVVLCKWHPFYPFILSTSADSTARIFAPKSFLSQLIGSLNEH